MKSFTTCLFALAFCMLFAVTPLFAAGAEGKTLVGKTIEYQYDGGDLYRVVFSQQKKGISAHWYLLSGDDKGSNRKEEAEYQEVAPGVWFVSWIEPTQEAVNMVLNLNTNTVTCAYIAGKDRYFLRGKVTSVETE